MGGRGKKKAKEAAHANAAFEQCFHAWMRLGIRSDVADCLAAWYGNPTEADEDFCTEIERDCSVVFGDSEEMYLPEGVLAVAVEKAIRSLAITVPHALRETASQDIIYPSVIIICEYQDQMQSFAAQFDDLLAMAPTSSHQNDQLNQKIDVAVGINRKTFALANLSSPRAMLLVTAKGRFMKRLQNGRISPLFATLIVYCSVEEDEEQLSSEVIEDLEAHEQVKLAFGCLKPINAAKLPATRSAHVEHPDQIKKTTPQVITAPKQEFFKSQPFLSPSVVPDSVKDKERLEATYKDILSSNIIEEDALKAENGKLKAENKGLRAEHKTLKIEKEELKAEKETLKAEMAELKRARNGEPP